jgi:hypothetical protein
MIAGVCTVAASEEPRGAGVLPVAQQPSGLLLAAGTAAPQSAGEPLRSLQVELPGQELNAVKTSWPAIGCWFWCEEEFRPEGYKRFLDLCAKHSAFRLLTTSIRHPVEVTESKVHDQIKAAALYARQHGMAIVMDLDVRLARQAFMEKHPGEMQEIVRFRELALSDKHEASITIESLRLGDHYTFRARGYDPLSSRLLRVYSHCRSAPNVEPESIRDITARARVLRADADAVKVAIPFAPEDAGRTACVLASFTLFTPDVFAPHLVEFERDTLQQYADVPLAGACKDEWGFPGRFGPRTDDLYFSRAMAEAYAKRRPGHELARDMLLMVEGEKGRGGERAAAVNHYMEMNWQRNAAVETAYYHAVKQIFGPAAMSATHPTWFPYPCSEEVFKNGLDWWAVTRDLAQTDEVTPFSVRTALAKKWHSPLWYNMYYDPSSRSYDEDLWRHALGGGRMNFHPLWPTPTNQPGGDLFRLAGSLLRADCRVRLLNYISTAPIDCPVAVIFSHPRADNWAVAGWGNASVSLCDGLWKEGYYADLIPSSEIASGALKLAVDGHIEYGPQKYAAAVFYQPQFERPLAGQFFRRAAAAAKTALYRVGDWTIDFDGRPVDIKQAVPAAMKAGRVADCAAAIIAQLKAVGVEPQTTCTMRTHAGFACASMMPRLSGRCRLLDGTVILASGEKDVLGDPIRKTVNVRGREVMFDAVGVAAVRLRVDGRLEALAAGALKSFYGGGLKIDLPERIDVALWRDAGGDWHGVLQDWSGPVPAPLAALTADWQRLSVPLPYGQ